MPFIFLRSLCLPGFATILDSGWWAIGSHQACSMDVRALGRTQALLENELMNIIIYCVLCLTSDGEKHCKEDEQHTRKICGRKEQRMRKHRLKVARVMTARGDGGAYVFLLEIWRWYQKELFMTASVHQQWLLIKLEERQMIIII